MNNSLYIKKTYKLYIDGKFSRTESGRYLKWIAPKDNEKINFCRGSRKDFRNAVQSSRNVFNTSVSTYCSKLLSFSPLVC